MKPMVVFGAALAIVSIGLVPANVSSQPEPGYADGVTAKITLSGTGSAVWRPGPSGDYFVFVEVFQKQGDGTWTWSSIGSTLRVFTFTDHAVTETHSADTTGASASVSASVTVDDFDRASVGFTSAPSGAVTVNVPASALATSDGSPSIADVFVTFSDLGVDANTGSVPTSHHSLLKNRLIDRGDFDQADQLDYWGAHRVAVASV